MIVRFEILLYRPEKFPGLSRDGPQVSVSEAKNHFERSSHLKKEIIVLWHFWFIQVLGVFIVTPYFIDTDGRYSVPPKN